jgi:hypothetical protein
VPNNRRGNFLINVTRLQTVSGNEKELKDLEAKLTAILSIVKKYKAVGGISALNHRIKIFCEYVGFSRGRLLLMFPGPWSFK